MRVAAKAAVCASVATWLFTIILVVMLYSSASNMRVESEGISLNYDPSKQAIILSMRATVINGGFFDLTNVSLRIGVVSSEGNILAECGDTANIIRAGSSKTFNVSLRMNASEVAKALLFGETLLVACRVDVGVADIIKARAYIITGLKMEAGQIGVKS